MRRRLFLCPVALIGVAALVTRRVVSQDRGGRADTRLEPESAKAGQVQPGSDTESLVDIWVHHAMPSEHHRLLGKLVGEWHMAVKYRMNSQTPAVESKGTCRRRWILGKRFVLEEFDGGNLGLPFKGLAIYGYDSFEGRYTSVWVDTTSTAVTSSSGVCRESGKLITFEGRHGDPWTGQMRKSRGVMRVEADDRQVLELYEPDRDGTEFKVLEIVYTRASPPAPAKDE